MGVATSRPTPASARVVCALDSTAGTDRFALRASFGMRFFRTGQSCSLRADGVINHRRAFLFRALQVRWANVNVFVITDKNVSPRARGLALACPVHRFLLNSSGI